MGKRSAAVTFMALLLCGCSHWSGVGDVRSPEACASRNGIWASWGELHWGGSLSKAEKRKTLCRLPTGDDGKACAGKPNECRGDCLAPKGAEIGQEAPGVCSSHFFRSEDALLIIDGKVTRDYPISE